MARANSGLELPEKTLMLGILRGLCRALVKLTIPSFSDSSLIGQVASKIIIEFAKVTRLTHAHTVLYGYRYAIPRYRYRIYTCNDA